MKIDRVISGPDYSLQNIRNFKDSSIRSLPSCSLRVTLSNDDVIDCCLEEISHDLIGPTTKNAAKYWR